MDMYNAFNNATPDPIMTPSATTINYGITNSPFGTCLIAESASGICNLSFTCADHHPTEISRIQSRFPSAKISRDDTQATDTCAAIFDNTTPPPLDFHGTDFQLAVWNALINIPFGTTVSYSELASLAGHPNANRAVGTAVANNPIAFLIPCHRVIRADGSLGNYRWGSETKRAILQWEKAR